MSTTTGEHPGWTPDMTKGPDPKDWTWTWVGDSPWHIAPTDPGSTAGLTEWMRAMEAWGGLMAIKCRDLEARVHYLETHTAS